MPFRRESIPPGRLPWALLLQASFTVRLERQLVERIDFDLPFRLFVGGDKGFDTQDFVAEMREINVTPHVAQNGNGRRSAIDGRTPWHRARCDWI